VRPEDLELEEHEFRVGFLEQDVVQRAQAVVLAYETGLVRAGSA
jgi:hypothetical protein